MLCGLCTIRCSRVQKPLLTRSRLPLCLARQQNCCIQLKPQQCKHASIAVATGTGVCTAHVTSAAAQLHSHLVPLGHHPVPLGARLGLLGFTSKSPDAFCSCWLCSCVCSQPMRQESTEHACASTARSPFACCKQHGGPICSVPALNRLSEHYMIAVIHKPGRRPETRYSSVCNQVSCSCCDLPSHDQRPEETTYARNACINDKTDVTAGKRDPLKYRCFGSPAM